MDQPPSQIRLNNFLTTAKLALHAETADANIRCN